MAPNLYISATIRRLFRSIGSETFRLWHLLSSHVARWSSLARHTPQSTSAVCGWLHGAVWDRRNRADVSGATRRIRCFLECCQPGLQPVPPAVCSPVVGLGDPGRTMGAPAHRARHLPAVCSGKHRLRVGPESDSLHPCQGDARSSERLHHSPASCRAGRNSSCRPIRPSGRHLFELSGIRRWVGPDHRRRRCRYQLAVCLLGNDVGFARACVGAAPGRSPT